MFLILVVPVLFFILLSFIIRPRATIVPIQNRHVFISGGSSGIGLALAHHAVAQGAKVSILARNITNLEKAQEEIQLATGISVNICCADVRDAAALTKIIENAAPIDVLICNHGIFIPKELEVQEIEDVKATLDINVMGTFNLIKAALPGMKKKIKETGVAGSIAIMSSQAGQVGLYGCTAYSASKFALRGLAEALQQEVINDNIRVTSIFPPTTDTPGLTGVNKIVPEVTDLMIASATPAMKTNDVAKIFLKGIREGSFIVPCNFLGSVVAIATAGLSPQPSVLSAFFEVSFAGLMRFLGLCMQWHWYTILEKWHMKKNKNEMIPGPKASGVMLQE